MESSTLKTGSRLKNGEYSIIRVLGQGGFGITYEAEQTGLRRKVAVKEFFMKDSCERNESTSYVTVPTASNRDLVTKFRDKFVREARMIAALDNEHIVKVHDVFEENGTAYYVMEYLDGGSLNGRIRDNGAMPEAEALGYVRQIADALQYLHSQNILHFDVKPSNVLMGRNGRAKLIDFGISKHYDESGHQTSSTPVGISKGFAPLEQYKQGSDLSSFTPATDIYALGATLYALLAEENPPEASDVSEDGLPIIDGVSPTVMHAIESAMQPRRKDRPQSVVEFLGLLDGGSKDNGGTDRAGHGSAGGGDGEDTVINGGGNAGGGSSVPSGTKSEPQSADSGKSVGRKKSSIVKWIAGGVAVFFFLRFLSLLFLLLSNGEKPEPDSILIDGMRECTAEFESKASEREFRIEKNFGERWAYSGVPDWCSTVPAEGKISLKVTENKTKEDRVAAIEFRKEGGSVVLSRLTISQKAKAVVPQKQSVQSVPEKQVPSRTSQTASAPSVGTNNGHAWVDLGLSVKWATCNVGATKPEGYGSYFAWGETSTKSEYSWESYKFHKTGDSWQNVTFNKYDGSIDNKIRLELGDDAARANWGGNWRMPTASEFNELMDRCTWIWTTMNGVDGYKVVSEANGNSIFLPAAGCRFGTDLLNEDSYGSYWSALLCEEYFCFACRLYFNSGDRNTGGTPRHCGNSVRPVCP